MSYSDNDQAIALYIVSVFHDDPEVRVQAGKECLRLISKSGYVKLLENMRENQLLLPKEVRLDFDRTEEKAELSRVVEAMDTLERAEELHPKLSRVLVPSQRRVLASTLADDNMPLEARLAAGSRLSEIGPLDERGLMSTMKILLDEISEEKSKAESIIITICQSPPENIEALCRATVDDLLLDDKKNEYSILYDLATCPDIPENARRIFGEAYIDEYLGTFYEDGIICDLHNLIDVSENERFPEDVRRRARKELKTLAEGFWKELGPSIGKHEKKSIISPGTNGQGVAPKKKVQSR